MRGNTYCAGTSLNNFLQEPESSLLDPLADDTIPALLIFYGPMFTAWGVVGFLASRKTGRVVDGIKAAVIVALVTGIVFDVMLFLRVNLFLHTLTDRPDWQNMVALGNLPIYQSANLPIPNPHLAFILDIAVVVRISHP